MGVVCCYVEYAQFQAEGYGEGVGEHTHTQQDSAGRTGGGASSPGGKR